MLLRYTVVQSGDLARGVTYLSSVAHLDVPATSLPCCISGTECTQDSRSTEDRGVQDEEVWLRAELFSMWGGEYLLTDLMPA